MSVGCIWENIDDDLLKLRRDGVVKLPSLQGFDLNNLARRISNEMRGATFSELCSSHQSFLKELAIEERLVPKLFDIACQEMGYNGDIDDQYHIARRVEPGNSREIYRAHFDSHLFTLVLPIKIPVSYSGGSIGDLIYFPNARKQPVTEMRNFLDKLYFKRFASRQGLDLLSKKRSQYVSDFRDYQPLLFAGRTTLHANKPVNVDCSGDRLTLLAHFFDPSPSYGVGNLLRRWRAR